MQTGPRRRVVAHMLKSRCACPRSRFSWMPNIHGSCTMTIRIGKARWRRCASTGIRVGKSQLMSLLDVPMIHATIVCHMLHARIYNLKSSKISPEPLKQNPALTDMYAYSTTKMIVFMSGERLKALYSAMISWRSTVALFLGNVSSGLNLVLLCLLGAPGAYSSLQQLPV